jgi:hypothetical protein
MAKKWAQFATFVVNDLGSQPFYEIIHRDLPVLEEEQFMALVSLFPKDSYLHQLAFEHLDGPVKFLTESQPLKSRTLSWFIVSLQRHLKISRREEDVKNLQKAFQSALGFEKEYFRRGLIYFDKGADYLIPGLTPSIGAKIIVQLSQGDNGFTADHFIRMVSYYSGDLFDVDVRTLAMQTLTRPTLECVRLLTEDDSPWSRSLLSSRYLLQEWKAGSPIDKHALNWASPVAIQQILTSELHTVTDNQFVLILEHFWNNKDLIEALSIKLNDPVKRGLLAMLVKSRNHLLTEGAQEAAQASKIGTLIHSVGRIH